MGYITDAYDNQLVQLICRKRSVKKNPLFAFETKESSQIDFLSDFSFFFVKRDSTNYFPKYYNLFQIRLLIYRCTYSLLKEIT